VIVSIRLPGRKRPTRRESTTARRRTGPRGRRWPLYVALALLVPLAALSAIAGFYYVLFSRQIAERMSGAENRSLPRVLARPFEIRRGQAISESQLVDRLNDLGYAHRAHLEQPGEFHAAPRQISFIPRTGRAKGHTVRVRFRRTPRGAGRGWIGGIERIELAKAGAIADLELDAPVLSEIVTQGRQKRRRIALAQAPRHVIQAVLAIEDRRFYDHPGVDIIRTLGAIVTNLRGDRPYLVGGSTLTQQLVKNFFLTPEKTFKRKLLEQFMALILERRLTKDAILTLYLNDVYLGQRGSFAIHGVAEGARAFFNKDISNVSLAEAALIAGVIQSPQVHSPFKSLDRARERRNVVLDSMARAGFIPQETSVRVAREPVLVSDAPLGSDAPYFVDAIAQMLQEQHPSLLAANGVEVQTTLDLQLQRLAEDVVRDEMRLVDRRVPRRGRSRGAPQASLIAVDPATGDVLALVGGRSYSASQYNRAVHARRQPGSVFKPFVYLAAFEHAGTEGLDLSPATLVVDEPTTFWFEQQEWTPSNYDGRFDGPLTLRRALALSRNIPTVKVAEQVGFDRVAALWKRVGATTPPRPFPSIALGVFEATPVEIATAYTIFANNGELRPLRWIRRITAPDRAAVAPPAAKERRIASAEATYLVTDMMRSVLDEGTGRAARAAGFGLHAAGKSGTTNDLRDAWFVGFTPELLTVVWVGHDDNRPLGLTGSQAALPIWTAFMRRALAGHGDHDFAAPEGLVFVDIDPDTGALVTPFCPRVMRETFMPGSEPFFPCDLHRY
jgi:penicillin-binding protein 1B